MRVVSHARVHRESNPLREREKAMQFGHSLYASVSPVFFLLAESFRILCPLLHTHSALAILVILFEWITFLLPGKEEGDCIERCLPGRSLLHTCFISLVSPVCKSSLVTGSRRMRNNWLPEDATALGNITGTHFVSSSLCKRARDTAEQKEEDEKETEKNERGRGRGRESR